MLLPPWKIPPVEPVDATALDGLEDLSDDEFAALVDLTPDDPPDDRATAPAATGEQDDAPDCHHHTLRLSSPALYIPACP